MCRLNLGICCSKASHYKVRKQIYRLVKSAFISGEMKINDNDDEQEGDPVPG